jgi:hypothetical protein
LYGIPIYGTLQLRGHRKACLQDIEANEKNLHSPIIFAVH